MGASGTESRRSPRHGQNGRGVAVGRHNYLFAGSDRGAERSAIFFTFIASCQLHGVDPVAWLTAVLPRIPTTRASQLANLLPDLWRAGRASAGNESQAA